MMAEFRAQAARFGTTFITDDVTRVDFSERPFKVFVGDEEHLAQTVIVATGATARQLGLESERALHGRGVTYCATCDGAFYRDREVVVVGGGDSAMEEALFLTKFASKVTIVHRRDDFRASQIMIDRARNHEKIEILTPYVVNKVLGIESGKLAGVRLSNVETGETLDYSTDGLFVAIGHDPTTKLFVDALDHDENGYLITAGKSTETNIPGVFASGDVRVPRTARRSRPPAPAAPRRSTRNAFSRSPRGIPRLPSRPRANTLRRPRRRPGQALASLRWATARVGSTCSIRLRRRSRPKLV